MTDEWETKITKSFEEQTKAMRSMMAEQLKAIHDAYDATDKISSEITNEADRYFREMGIIAKLQTELFKLSDIFFIKYPPNDKK
jgi:hypothetical protein